MLALPIQTRRPLGAAAAGSPAASPAQGAQDADSYRVAVKNTFIDVSLDEPSGEEPDLVRCNKGALTCAARYSSGIEHSFTDAGRTDENDVSGSPALLSELAQMMLSELVESTPTASWWTAHAQPAADCPSLRDVWR